MSAHEPIRGHRTRMARPFIGMAFLLQRCGDAVVIYAASLPSSPNPVLRGVAIAMLIWATALTVGVWRRLRWARYFLTTLSWLYVFGLAFAALVHWEAFSIERIDPRSLPLVGALLYLISAAILVRSRRVRHFASR